MARILCRYCSHEIGEGEKIFLAKEPHRAPEPAHENCGKAAKEDRPRVELTPKAVLRGAIVDRHVLVQP